MEEENKLSHILNYNHLISPPNFKTKLISLISITFFLVALVVGAYVVSILNGKLSGSDFTISRALEYGNKYIMIIFFTVSFALIIYLNYLRSKTFAFKERIAILVIIYIFLITIMWVTMTLDRNLHYIFAGIIFTANIVYLFIISYIFTDYLKREQIVARYALDIIIVLTLITWIALFIFGVLGIDENGMIADEEIFAIAENITIFLTALPVIYLGFC